MWQLSEETKVSKMAKVDAGREWVLTEEGENNQGHRHFEGRHTLVRPMSLLREH